MKLASLPGSAGLCSLGLHLAVAAVVSAFVTPAAIRRSPVISVEIRRKPLPAPAPSPAAVALPAPAAAAELAKPKPAAAPSRPRVAALPRPAPIAATAPAGLPVAAEPAPHSPAPESAAAVDASPAAPAGGATTLSGVGVGSGKGVDLSGYLGRITGAVAARRRYPALALELQLEGDAVVSVRVNRDGTLAAEPFLAQSCGHQLLDAEALRMVRQAAPFPPLPADYPALTAELRLPVRFRLES